jgi:hypothetical protein
VEIQYYGKMPESRKLLPQIIQKPVNVEWLVFSDIVILIPHPFSRSLFHQGNERVHN